MRKSKGSALTSDASHKWEIRSIVGQKIIDHEVQCSHLPCLPLPCSAFLCLASVTNQVCLPLPCLAYWSVLPDLMLYLALTEAEERQGKWEHWRDFVHHLRAARSLHYGANIASWGVSTEQLCCCHHNHSRHCTTCFGRLWSSRRCCSFVSTGETRTLSLVYWCDLYAKDLIWSPI
jgi:hypothetical protein